MNACLSCGVVGLPELASLTIDRGDVDDASPALGQHALDDLLGRVEQAGEIGINHRPPVLRGHLAEGAVAGDASIVDQYIDRADSLVHHVEGLAGAVPVGDVAVDAVEVEARLELLGNPGGLAAGVGITAHHHGESIPIQALADRRTDTAHTTGDQCYTCRIARNTH